jgi:tRNA 2-thiouridine synthesizing protein A
MSSRTLDLCGLKCPLPVLRTRKALAGLSVGERLTVLATDPLATIDIPNLVRELGDTLLEQSEADERRIFLIEKR